MNSCILIGNLGKDAQVKQFDNRYRVTFSMATSEKYNGKEETHWHNVTYWTSSQGIAQYLTKGAKVVVNGSYQYDKMNDGKYWYYLKAKSVRLLSNSTDHG